MIQAFLIINNFGKPRLLKFYKQTVRMARAHGHVFFYFYSLASLCMRCAAGAKAASDRARALRDVNRARRDVFLLHRRLFLLSRRAGRAHHLPAVRDARAHRARARARRDDESTAPLGLPYGFDYWSERNAVLDVEPEEVVELLWRALRERVAPVRTEPSSSTM